MSLFKNGNATSRDVDRLARGQEKLVRELRNSDRQSGTSRAVKALGHGFGNIVKSLSSPSTRRRIKISQMPSSRSEMDIVRHATSSNLKANGLRHRDIRGRKVK